MYYREFGIPARIARCYSIEELEIQVDKFNGDKNCYTSVYVFDDRRENPRVKSSWSKTDYDSAAINTLWFDFDDEKDVNKCLLV